MRSGGVARLGRRDPARVADARDRSELTISLLQRSEPFVLVLLALHVTINLLANSGPVTLITAGAACQVIGVVALVRPGGPRFQVVRALIAVALLVAMSIHLDHQLLVFMPWYPVLAVAYGLTLGARRAWPIVALVAIPYTVAAFDTFDGAGPVVMRVVPTAVLATLLGLISDGMRDSVLAAREAVAREYRLRSSVDTAPIGIMTIDLEGRTTLVNSAITHFLRIDSAPAHLEDFLQHVHHGDSTFVDELRVSVAEGRPARGMLRVVHPTRGLRHVRVLTATMVDAAGELIGSVVTVQDVHEEVDYRRKLEQFRRIADSTSDMIGIASVNPHSDYLNPAGQQFFGVERVSLADIESHVPTEYHSLLFDEVFLTVSAGATWSGELELFDRDHARRTVSAVVVGLFDELNELESFAAIYRDMHERKALESKLAFDAGHDQLTGLPNRQQLFHTLAATLAAGDPVAVLFCDLDGFKLVNDSLGHAVGDELLVSVAGRLVDSARANDLVGRLGGDEFVVVCREALTGEAAMAIAQRFIDVVRQPIVIDGREHVVSTSIGIAIGGESTSASELVQQADLAMYAAKGTGRRRVAVFDSEMRVRADQRMELEADLRSALAHGEIELHYQPIVNTVTSEVVGFEALARWRHPSRGLLLPKEFMPVVDSAGFARTFGEFVIREATTTAAMMRLIAPRLTMSINLSRHQLLDARLVDIVAGALGAAQLPASALSIEITEEMVIDEITAAQPRLDALRDLGVRFAIDDFGTGYSNLTMLKQFSADYVKIDRSLIHGESELMQLVLSLTRELGFAAIAEGVETAEQLDELRRHGCHHAQGYYFAKPMNTAEATSFLESTLAADAVVTPNPEH
jgi:diguanylate cyclase (GGDEF)-like protein/PAS domain S-box-containing protein